MPPPNTELRTPQFLNITDPEQRAAMRSYYESLPAHTPELVVRCPTHYRDGRAIPKNELPGCGSTNVTWDGDVYDCYDCGIFFSDYAADPPHRQWKEIRDEAERGRPAKTLTLTQAPPVQGPKPRYFVCTNAAPAHFEHSHYPTIEATARAVRTLTSAAAALLPDTPCVFLLVVRNNTLEFLHADRFLDGVASGDICEASSAQRG